jgi:hypothetical protein
MLMPGAEQDFRPRSTLPSLVDATRLSARGALAAVLAAARQANDPVGSVLSVQMRTAFWIATERPCAAANSVSV